MLNLVSGEIIQQVREVGLIYAQVVTQLRERVQAVGSRS